MQKRSFQVASAALLSAQAVKDASRTEKVVGTPEKYEFLAETKQLLNIVAKSLYSDKEVFVRELISNASDAIEKLKYAQLSGDQSASSVESNQIPFEIRIDANDINNTLTIQVNQN
jgi:TNF receptor-associated protein 1